MDVREAAEILVAAGTLLLAVATVYLGFETRRLARETLEGIQQSDREHQEALTPIVKVITNFFPKTFASAPANQTLPDFELTVANRGTGPALDLSVHYIVPGLESQGFDMGPIGINEEIVNLAGLQLQAGFHPAQSRWRVELRYKNLFGSPASTIYTSATNQPFYSRPPVIVRERKLNV